MIDREKVKYSIERCISHVPDACRDCAYDAGHPYKCVEMMLKDVLAMLKEQEAKTGKWIEKTDYLGDTYYDCSVCDESWTTIEGTPWVNGMNYCPHCGAKMEFEGR